MGRLYVSNRDESVRMFGSDLLERCTHVHPVVPHVIFVPVIGYALFLTARRGLDPGTTVLLLLAGVLFWTLTEYSVHRFLFHVDPAVQDGVREIIAHLRPGEAVLPALLGWRQRYYFLAHGVHHDFPNDSRRLVMPPAVSIPLAILFFLAFRAVVGPPFTPPFFAGFVAGYLLYDTIHYTVHHIPPKTGLGRRLKKHHFRHHYSDSGRNFGVSSPIWDAVLGTLDPHGVRPLGIRDR